MNIFELAVIERQGVKDEPILSLASGTLIVNPRVDMPRLMPESIRIKMEQGYRTECFLPVEGLFQAEIGDLSIVVDNFCEGVVVVHLHSAKAYFVASVVRNGILLSVAHSQRHGKIHYVSVPVACGQAVQVRVGSREE